MNEHAFIPRHPGFLVWCPEGLAPRYQHPSVEHARVEAKRLAKANPGKRFFVLEPIGLAYAGEPAAMFFTVERGGSSADLDADLPF